MAHELRQAIVVSAVLMLALFLPLQAAETPPPAPPVERIVAVGDIHGDYDQFVKVLRAAEIIDKDNKWIGGKAHLVQTGDVLDRGPDSRKAMDLLMALEEQAAKAGGAVHALIGNHEAMVLLGSWQYVSPKEEAAFGGEEQYRKAMSPEGKYGKWIRGHDAIVKINDLIFVHACLRAAYATKPLKELNQEIRQQLIEGAKDGPATDYYGPLWDRYFALGDEDKVAEELGTVLKECGAAHMVVGHTVDMAGVISRAGGRLIRIDVGMSKVYGGPAICLLVDKGVFYEVCGDPVWKRKLELKAPAVKTLEPAPAPAKPPVPEPAPATSKKAA
jgi:hypothetical protein